ncbi:MAG TPA: class I SAM-dependent methyltransferase [Solirubrobacteraceae bacterium]|nr:class I SAM-dependent methyltransferase [Solirubrobacteraceae bacterium]
MTSALELYEAALDAPDGLRVRFDDGSLAPLPVSRYVAAADPLDRRVLAGLEGPVLDVGCGPGRHLHALAGAGIFALGVDISPAAVALARRGGGRAVVADVFGRVPAAGRWASALLLDGNIGIGGAPARLLARLGELVMPGGAILVEVEAPGRESTSRLARIEVEERVSGWFAWARVSAAEIGTLAGCVNLSVEEIWSCQNRWFARLRGAPAA